MTRLLSMTLAASLFGGVAYAQEIAPTPVVATEPTPPPPAPPTDSGFKITGFVDGFYSVSTQKTGSQYPDMGGMPSGISDPAHGAYARNNGFGLSFAGMDAVYDSDKAGATISLRYGPSVTRYFAGTEPASAANVTQAFATLKPSDAMSIDFGQFYTIYGAEVAESWLNYNYTRGGLYYAMQPFWHTGARLNYKLSDQLTIKGMLVNGTNRAIETTKNMPGVGLQVAYTAESFSVIAGYLGSLDSDSEFFDQFFDVVASTKLGSIELLANFDYGMNKGDADFSWLGASLAGRLALSEDFRVALRGEFLSDPDGGLFGPEDTTVMTGTLTLDWNAFGSQNAIVRFDARFDNSSEDIFLDGDGAATGSWMQGVVGVVVKTN